MSGSRYSLSGSCIACLGHGVACPGHDIACPGHDVACPGHGVTPSDGSCGIPPSRPVTVTDSQGAGYGAVLGGEGQQVLLVCRETNGGQADHHIAVTRGMAQ